MIKQGEVNKLPKSANHYALAKIVILLTLVSVPFAFVNAWFSAWLVILIFAGIPTYLIASARYNHTNFSVDENKILINWGILTKKSRSIMLNNIQNVAIEKGLLMGMFGIVELKIWTASQSQLNRDKDGNLRPDGLLMITKEDAGWLSEFVSSKK